MPCGSSKESCTQDKNAPNGHCAFEDLDHSVLQQPLNLGVTNVRQILKCVQSGSKEVKDIILNECNVIYECKVCVGLFRSLANFMYHKRCYCKKHLCEDMVLFEEFNEEQTITVQPEQPKAKQEETVQESVNTIECIDLEKSDDSQAVASGSSKNSKETAAGSKEKSASKRSKEVVTTTEKVASPMISRRTRDKNAQNPISTSAANKLAAKSSSSDEPPLKCAKIVHEKVSNKESDKTKNKESDKMKNKESDEKPTAADVKKDNQQDVSNKETKSKKIEYAKLSVSPEKGATPFPKIIFKAIDSNPHAVFQSDDKKKLDTFGVCKKFETAAVETKVENDKLIIVLKKDVNSGSSSSFSTSESSKQKSEADKATDFHLTRRKKLMARNDCDVHDLKCLVCKTQFMSLKTLYFHMLSLHSKKRLYYPCPFCKTFFVQMYGVTRHLISIHKKTKEQINKLREVIKKKSVWKKIDDVNPGIDTNISPVNYQIKNSPPYEEKKEPPETNDNENNETDSLKTVIKFDKNVLLHQCSKCNRVFGRKSSQVSHQKFCIMTNPVKSEGEPSAPLQPTAPVLSFVSLPPKSPVSSKPASIIQFDKFDNNLVRSTEIEKQASDMKTKHDIKMSIRPKRGAEKQMHKDFVNSQTLKWRSANRIETNANPGKILPATTKKNTAKNLEKKVLSIMSAESLTCLKCDKKFSSYSNLRRHVAIHVGWTRFKCKFCDYQAYNKSQCWSHVQKAHSVEENEMDKSIVNLVNNNSTSYNKKPTASSQQSSSSKQNTDTSPAKSNSIPKVKISKKKVLTSTKIVSSEKKQVPIQKKDQPEMKKEKEADTNESKKDKPQTVMTVQKIAKKVLPDAKKEKTQPAVSVQRPPKKENAETKKEKSQHVIPIQKITLPDYKKETNYKSVTTSNPTTIILSKKIPTATVPSFLTLSPENVSSSSKVTSIRTSPRKSEIKGPGERLITTLVTRSSAYSKATPVQIKLPARSNSMDELSKESPDKNSSKKRMISEWFPKKDLSSSSIRRESAPLIIGLVPAGLNAQAKNSAVPLEKNNP